MSTFIVVLSLLVCALIFTHYILYFPCILVCVAALVTLLLSCASYLLLRKRRGAATLKYLAIIALIVLATRAVDIIDYAHIMSITNKAQQAAGILVERSSGIISHNDNLPILDSQITNINRRILFWNYQEKDFPMPWAKFRGYSKNTIGNYKLARSWDDNYSVLLYERYMHERKYAYRNEAGKLGNRAPSARTISLKLTVVNYPELKVLGSTQLIYVPAELNPDVLDQYSIILRYLNGATNFSVKNLNSSH